MYIGTEFSNLSCKLKRLLTENLKDFALENEQIAFESIRKFCHLTADDLRNKVLDFYDCEFCKVNGSNSNINDLLFDFAVFELVVFYKLSLKNLIYNTN